MSILNNRAEAQFPLGTKIRVKNSKYTGLWEYLEKTTKMARQLEPINTGEKNEEVTYGGDDCFIGRMHIPSVADILTDPDPIDHIALGDFHKLPTY